MRLFVLRSIILSFFIIISVLLPFGAACKSTNSVDASAVELREVTDDLGRKINVPVKIERVVSLAPSLTESVFAVGAGAKLVGVTEYCNFPAEAKQIAKIGDTMKPNLETIIALKPQLVLVSTDSQLEAFIRQMEAQKIPVFVTDAKNFDGVLRNLRQIAALLDVSAEKLINDLQTRRVAVENRTAGKQPVRVFVQISREPLYTIGKTSFLTDFVKRAGGESVTANIETAYPQISRETALAAQPDAIVLSIDDSMSGQNVTPDDVFKDSPAVKNNRVYKINGDLLTRPSPRSVELIEQIADALHH